MPVSHMIVSNDMIAPDLSDDGVEHMSLMCCVMEQ